MKFHEKHDEPKILHIGLTDRELRSRQKREEKAKILIFTHFIEQDVG